MVSVSVWLRPTDARFWRPVVPRDVRSSPFRTSRRSSTLNYGDAVTLGRLFEQSAFVVLGRTEPTDGTDGSAPAVHSRPCIPGRFEPAARTTDPNRLRAPAVQSLPPRAGRPVPTAGTDGLCRPCNPGRFEHGAPSRQLRAGGLNLRTFHSPSSDKAPR